MKHVSRLDREKGMFHLPRFVIWGTEVGGMTREFGLETLYIFARNRAVMDPEMAPEDLENAFGNVTFC